jgi:hypothetical protein
MGQYGECVGIFNIAVFSNYMRMDITNLMQSQTKDTFQKLADLQNKMKSISILFKKRNYSRPDDLFFSIEDLSIMGKEYWFLHFCSAGSKDQAVITFGRALDSVQVNKTKVHNKEIVNPILKRDELSCASVAWIYDGKKSQKLAKKIVIDSLAKVILSSNVSKNKNREITAIGSHGSASICGKYPDYKITLYEKAKKVFYAHAHLRKKHAPYEIIDMFSQPIIPGLGASMVNYYFDFDGQINNRKISGSAYLQKVVASLFLTPWNWVRICFRDGSVVDFFSAKPLGQKNVEVACVGYFEHKGRRTSFNSLKLDSWGSKNKKKWILHSKDFLLSMNSYALQKFKMSSKTKFEYDEYLVSVSDFFVRVKKDEIFLKDVGAGSGIVEDATGYLL